MMASRPRPIRIRLVERYRGGITRDWGSVAAVPPLLGIPRKTFYDKVARLGIKIEDFRDRPANGTRSRKPD